LVCSPSGEFVDSSGSSKDLGGQVDKLWLGALRSGVDVVLTSGRTFRAEQYRMPKRADLAVLSRLSVDQSNLVLSEGQSVIEFTDSDYAKAAVELANNGLKRIHIEFGPTGISALVQSAFEFNLWLSGLSDTAVELGARKLGLEAQIIARVDGLSIARAR
jgi:riboflavin biosynthesis pyrimidine reductase